MSTAPSPRSPTWRVLHWHHLQRKIWGENLWLEHRKWGVCKMDFCVWLGDFWVSCLFSGVCVFVFWFGSLTNDNVTPAGAKKLEVWVGSCHPCTQVPQKQPKSRHVVPIRSNIVNSKSPLFLKSHLHVGWFFSRHFGIFQVARFGDFCCALQEVTEVQWEHSDVDFVNVKPAQISQLPVFF